MNDIDDNEDNDTRPADTRPLGFWLRAVDGLLTREFATTLEAEGVSRREWMLLNLLSGDIGAPELRERLARKGKRLRGLEERGWAEHRGDGSWTLTALGRAEKERIGELVDGIRARVAGAVGDDAYAQLTGSLEAIARELGGDDTAARGAGSGGRGVGRRGSGFGPGFGPGFGGFGPRRGRPRPFAPDIHDGHGPNLHRGFAPGRPGRPAERFDEPFSDRGHDHGDVEEGCRGHHPFASHSHHGHHAAHCGHGHHHGDHGHHRNAHHGDHGHHRNGHHGDHGHHHGHSHHSPHHGGRGERRAQRAYERGFDAGFTRGQESGAA